MITGWESAEVLEAAVADTLRRFRERIAAEEVTVGLREHGITVVMSLDGYLASVAIADRARARYAPDELGRIVTDAVGRAERAAAERRGELAAALEVS